MKRKTVNSRIFTHMKRKAITKKINVKNRSFIDAITASVGKTSEIHKEIVTKAKKNGILTKLTVSK